MPKIKITEIDRTGSMSLAEQPNIVYIPGGASSKTKPFLYTSAKAFLDTKNTNLEDKAKYIKDKSYYLALRLLKLGMQVLYQGFPLVSGEATVSSNSFTIANSEGFNIDYSVASVSGGTEISWSEDSESKSAMVNELGVVILSEGLVAEYTSEKVTYPVAVASNSVAISEDKKFVVDDVEYTLGDNQITYDGAGSPISVVNGKATLSKGEVATIDYLHGIVSYKQVYVNDGVINISSDDYKALEDKNLYNFRFLTTGGYACPTSSIITTAANRGDCVALIDHENYAEYSVKKVRDFVEGFKGATSEKQADPLAFASAFTPWFTAELEDENGASILEEVPGSFGYLLAYARSVQANPIWKAVAGVQRGSIPELKSVSYVLNNAECEVLQARATTSEVDLDKPGDNVGIAINPIAYRRYSGFSGGFNFVINGNRTMHENDEKAIATSFLNVRILISEISKTLYDASVAYMFEQNSEVLWFNFTSLITPLLNRMQSGEGIEGYSINRVATDKKARLKAKLTLVPMEAVEDFELEISLEDSIEVTE